MNDLEELLKFLFVAVVVVVGIVAIAFSISSWECNSYEKMTGKQTELTGGSCYVKENGQWYRYDEYKLRNATKGESK